INYASNNPYATPRLFFAGPLIDGADRVYKGEEPGFPELSIGIDESSDVDQIVDNLVTQGASFLKSYEMLSRPTYLRLLDIAKQKGLRVTGHIPLSISLMDAIDAGLGGMQHIRNLELACANDAEGLQNVRTDLLTNSNNKAGSALRSQIHSLQRYSAIENFDEQRCTKIIQALARHNVFQTPTLTINTFGSQRLYSDQNWRDTYDYLPPLIKESWLAQSLALSDNSVDENALIFEDWSMKVVKLFSENNVKILAGTDTPIGFLTPGFSLHKELELLVKAGLSPREALTSATVSPAEFFNLQTQMGSLDVGKVADVLVLNKNPLEDIRHTQDINLVIAKGVLQSN
ncbi:MAG: amidohydrolase family protein, partial [Porticoccaceae bacterium]|nr:amidohydrolase family protein [Porticoccaceae bacterium]